MDTSFGNFKVNKKMSKNLIAAAVLATAGMAAPAFADTTLHVFLWDSLETMDMVDDHIIGNDDDRSTDVMGVTVNTTVIPAGKVTFERPLHEAMAFG
ncbi:hypothetical protein [Profundibacter sp.]|uniref:hypothetical protein n=1 Tax=Profundibacter sp. TaxID=3101071 RepID=UPI003D141885